jgi:hypothetical protein
MAPPVLLQTPLTGEEGVALGKKEAPISTLSIHRHSALKVHPKQRWESTSEDEEGHYMQRKGP